MTKIIEKLESSGGRRETKFRREFEKCEFELFFDYARFLSKNAVFKRNNQQLRVSVRYCVWMSVATISASNGYWHILFHGA